LIWSVVQLGSKGCCYQKVELVAGIGLHIHSGLTPRGLPLSDAAKATAADSRHKSAATPFIF
jgi:hypothetical protein